MNTQHTHDTTINEPNATAILLICDGVSGPANIGGLFRICDAFGVQKIIFCASNINFDTPRLLKTARNTTKTIPFNVSDKTAIDEVRQLSSEGWKTIALEISSESIPIKKLKLEASKIVLVVGNEKSGVSSQVLKETDITTHIQMYGKNSSMNVVQATTIALFALT